MYREYAVMGALARYIECAWVLTPEASANSASDKRIFPDGATDIVIASGKGAVAYGPATTFRLMPVGMPMLGLRIRTGAAPAVLGISLPELEPRPLSIRMLWGRHGSELDEQLSAESRPTILAAILQRSLRRRLDKADRLDSVVLTAVERLRRSQNVTVRRLASDAGLCERHLRRRFERNVGMSIKQYARITRFQSLLDAVRMHQRRCGPISPGWAELAADYGYADQAHLIREVRAFAGLSPTELLQGL
jgi:AraC-like DNA-binding protein